MFCAGMGRASTVPCLNHLQKKKTLGCMIFRWPLRKAKQKSTSEMKSTSTGPKLRQAPDVIMGEAFTRLQEAEFGSVGGDESNV